MFKFKDACAAFNADPSVREYRREYESRPNVKAKRKAYRERPEVRERQREYQKRYYLDPVHREKRAIRNKLYYESHKKDSAN